MKVPSHHNLDSRLPTFWLDSRSPPDPLGLRLILTLNDRVFSLSTNFPPISKTSAVLFILMNETFISIASTKWQSLKSETFFSPKMRTTLWRIPCWKTKENKKISETVNLRNFKQTLDLNLVSMGTSYEDA